MVTIDTNVVVRFLVNDDPAQARRARALLEREEVFISPTVLLEAQWVLRGAHGFDVPEILGFLRALLGLPGVSTQAPAQVALALEAYGAGLDFADALHLLLNHEAQPFFTFDKPLRQRASRVVPSLRVASP